MARDQWRLGRRSDDLVHREAVSGHLAMILDTQHGEFDAAIHLKETTESPGDGSRSRKIREIERLRSTGRYEELLEMLENERRETPREKRKIHAALRVEIVQILYGLKRDDDAYNVASSVPIKPLSTLKTEDRDDDVTHYAMLVYAQACALTGRFPASFAVLDDLLQYSNRVYGRDHPKTRDYARRCAGVQQLTMERALDKLLEGHRSDAENLLSGVLNRYLQREPPVLDPENLDIDMKTMMLILWLCEQFGRYMEVARLGSACLPIAEKHFSSGSLPREMRGIISRVALSSRRQGPHEETK